MPIPRRPVMPVERVPGSSSLIDVLDRVLDKGIVVDGWARISLDGIDVISENARVVVVSSDTHLAYDGSITASGPAVHAAVSNPLREDRSRRSGARAARRRH
jgi:gas vesicle structural protein